MSSTALSATNKIESNKIVRKNKIIYKKMYEQYKTIDKIYWLHYNEIKKSDGEMNISWF